MTGRAVKCAEESGTLEDELTPAGSCYSLAERRRSHERRRRARWLAVGTVAGGVVVVLGVVQLRDHVAHEALSVPVRHEAREGDPRVPAVVWPRGLSDHGAWADDPWVDALREYRLVLAAAGNSGRVAGRGDLLRVAVPEVVDIEDEADRQEYLDSLMERYDALRELTQREARR